MGNSQGIRIPKSILETASMRENDKVEIIPEQGDIITLDFDPQAGHEQKGQQQTHLK